MARLLRIENCYQCHGCLYVPETARVRSDYTHLCLVASDRPVYRYGDGIPDWCPLPEAKEVGDGEYGASGAD